MVVNPIHQGKWKSARYLRNERHYYCDYGLLRPGNLLNESDEVLVVALFHLLEDAADGIFFEML